MHSGAVGAILVVVSAVSFGLIPLFASWARDGETPLETRLGLRFAIAGVVLGAIALARGARWARGGALWTLLFMGAGLYFAQSWCYFQALEVGTPSGLVALLLYLNPAIVAALARLFFKEALTRRRLAAIALAIGGTALMLGPTIGLGSGRRAPIEGVLYGLGAACTYAVYLVVGSRATRGQDDLASTALICLGAAVSFCALALTKNSLQLPASGTGWLGIALLAIVSTVVAVTTLFAGMKRIGPVRAATLSTIEAATAVVVGAIALGDPMGIVQLAGGALVLGGAVVMARAGETKT